jgi:GTP cyclohydrolase I
MARPFAFGRHLEEASDEPEADDARTENVARKFREVLVALGLDLNDPNLVGTEWRVARAYREIFAGLRPGAEPVLRTFPNPEGYREPVAVTDIGFHSLCAHHFLPFFGVAHVAYLPKDRLVGLSKIGRVVEHYARRPQLQERLTEQVAGLLEARLRPAGLMVVVAARHLCMEMRGLGKTGQVTSTSAVRGAFPARRRRELLDLVARGAGGRGGHSVGG